MTTPIKRLRCRRARRRPHRPGRAPAQSPRPARTFQGGRRRRALGQGARPSRAPLGRRDFRHSGGTSRSQARRGRRSPLPTATMPTSRSPRSIADCMSSRRSRSATTVEDATRVAAARDRAGRVVQVGYMKRFDPSWRLLAEMVGGLGERLRLISVEVNDPDSWPYTAHRDYLAGDDVPAGLIEESGRRRDAQIARALGGTPGAAQIKGFAGPFCASMVHDVNLVHGLLDAMDLSTGEVTGAADLRRRRRRRGQRPADARRRPVDGLPPRRPQARRLCRARHALLRRPHLRADVSLALPQPSADDPDREALGRTSRPYDPSPPVLSGGLRRRAERLVAGDRRGRPGRQSRSRTRDATWRCSPRSRSAQWRRRGRRTPRPRSSDQVNPRPSLRGTGFSAGLATFAAASGRLSSLPSRRETISRTLPRRIGGVGAGLAGTGSRFSGRALPTCEGRTSARARFVCLGSGTASALNDAERFDQACSEPQAGHLIRDTVGGSVLNRSASISTPVDTSLPVRGQRMTMTPIPILPRRSLPAALI